MKKVYYFFHEKVQHTVYVGENAEFISAHWEISEGCPDEAIEKVIEHLGGELIELNGADCFPENPEDDLEEDDFANEDLLKEWVERAPIKSMLKEAIRSIEAELSSPAVSSDEEEFSQTEVVNHIGPLVQKMEEEEDKQKEEEKKMATKKKTTSSKKSSTTKKSSTPAKTKASKAKKPAKKPAAKPTKKPSKGGGKKK